MKRISVVILCALILLCNALQAQRLPSRNLAERYIATLMGNALYRFKDGRGEPMRYNLKSAVQTIHTGSSGEVFVGTSTGARRLTTDGSLIAVVSTLGSGGVNALLEDRERVLWIGKNDGLYRLERINDSTKDSARASEKPPFPIVRIDGVRADTALVSPYDYGRIEPNFGRLEIQVSELTLASPEKAKYRFKLARQGASSDVAWTGASANILSFKNLSSDATYLLTVQSTNQDSVWSEPATLTFSIQPRFYQKLDFYLWALLGVSVVVFLPLSQRKFAETELRRRVDIQTRDLQTALAAVAQKSEEVENVGKIIRAINSETSFTRLLNVILDESKLIGGVECATVLLRDVDTGNLKFKTALGYSLSELSAIELTPDDAEERYVNHSVKLADDIFVFENLPERTAMIESANEEDKRRILTAQKFPIFTGKFEALPLPVVMIVMRIRVESRIEGYITFENQSNINAFKRSDVGVLRNVKEPIVAAFSKTRLLGELQQQRDTLAEKTVALEQTLKDLQETQAQLVHAEKMASLGELTAGIAHEIQNPLNFVNNFSELSVDLTRELKTEIEKPSQDKDNIVDILSDLSGNMEKIAHHGKRASSIVRGMLEHCRESSGERYETDVNALLDEYLKLAHHGYRAKDQLFNAKLTTEFDESLPKLLVAPQDLSRVFLNILNNGFYSAYEKAKERANGFAPELSVCTKNLGNKVEIRIRDNGKGIPQAVMNKIFQPFFTTKPTG